MSENGDRPPIPPAVEARGLVKSYDDVEVVRGVDLRVQSGEVFGFLGPNGAGKPTTVRDWASIWPGFLVVAVAGALMLALNVRSINRYD